jgi:hypothetical protein
VDALGGGEDKEGVSVRVLSLFRSSLVLPRGLID